MKNIQAGHIAVTLPIIKAGFFYTYNAVIFSWPACEVYIQHKREHHPVCTCRIHVSLHVEARAIRNSVYYYCSNCRLDAAFSHLQVEGSVWWKKGYTHVKQSQQYYRYRRVAVVT